MRGEGWRVRCVTTNISEMLNRLNENINRNNNLHAVSYDLFLPPPLFNVVSSFNFFLDG